MRRSANISAREQAREQALSRSMRGIPVEELEKLQVGPARKMTELVAHLKKAGKLPPDSPQDFAA